MTQRDVTALKAFQEWFLSPAGPGLLRIPLYQPTHHESGVSAITLYRRNGYQAELCTLPQGQEYEIKIPEGSCALTAFLGGSLTYAFHSSEEITQAPEHLGMTTPFMTDESLPTHFIEEKYKNTEINNKELLESPHPLLLLSNSVLSEPLTEGESATFSAPRDDALILIFSFYSNENNQISSLRFIRPIS